MCRRLIFTLILCWFLTTVSSIRCYIGTDHQCLLAPDMANCSEVACQCRKYRAECTENDPACTEHEQKTHVKKWMYTIVSASTCRLLQTPSSGYEQTSCCSTDGCNRPDHGKCSLFQARRRALRKLTDILDP